MGHMLKYHFLAALMALAASAHAEPDTTPDTVAALVTDQSQLAARGAVDLALQLTPQPGWHLYWKNYGDTGSATSVSFTGWPAQSVVSDWDYPTPHRLPFGELMNYGFNQPITLLAKVTLPKNLSGKPFKVTAAANWLACTEEVCVPEHKDFSLLISGAAQDAKTGQIFASARAALPDRSGWPAAFHVANGQFQLKVKSGVDLSAVRSVEFFPDTAPLIVHMAPQLVLKKAGDIWLETQADIKAPPADIRGVLVIVDKDGTRHGHDLQFTRADAPLMTPDDAVVVGDMPQAQSSSPGKTLPFWLAFGFAFAGGLLLNLMPCVFPILALKAFALARAGESEHHARQEGLAYTAGVIATFAVIGGILLALRSGGGAIGWGFQLQDPRIVAGLGLLMVVVALNLAGVFDVGSRLGNLGGALTQKSGAAGAFWTGALAVVVATPCTAPFMAGALGAALALPPVGGMAIFIGLGLGMALPFLLLGYVPAFRRLLPRPGAWMDGFKRFLAFPMLATALWLFWVVGQLTDTTGMAAALAAALLLALGLWLWGRPATWVRGLGALALLAGAAVPFFMAQLPVSSASAAPSTATAMATEPYSDARLAELVGQGKPVFAYFTADWCISCKVNERVAIDRDEVASAFKANGVTVLVGDWTRRDEVLGKVLERHGRAGVPLYLFYGKGAALETPVVLPQVLTPDILITAATTAAK